MTDPSADRTHLAAAAADAHHMTELLAIFGLDGSRRTRRTIFDRLKRWHIDTSHWTHSPVRWYTDEALADAVARSISYADVLRRLGVPLSGGSHAYLATRIRAAGIDTTHFLGQAHRRGLRAPRRLASEILVVLPPGSMRTKAPLLRRALVASGVEERCVKCRLGDRWQGAPLRLIVDHINGDWLDNRLENLRFLCPNCHSQTATWCRRRSARRPTIEMSARLAE
jgi:hypothetical protein